MEIIMGIDRLEYLFHPKSIAVVGASERPGSVGGAVIRNIGQAAILDFSLKECIGFSHFISLGSMLDVDFGDIIDYLGTDTKIGSIVMYVESLTHQRNFMTAARGGESG
jgi:acetyltransferase